MPDKIINSFQQRRQLLQDIADLAQTATEAQLLEAVRTLVRAYPAELLVAVLLKHLDTASSQIRGGLGHLATLLPPEEIGPALRSVAANRQHSAQARVTAVLLLERFLGETVPLGLINDLSQTNEVAFQSLREAVEEGRRNRHVFIEYVTQMHQAGEPVAYMVMDLLERLAPAERVEFYRLIAQDDRAHVAQTALQALERLTMADREPRALAALYTLQFALPPQPAGYVERGLRKLAFAGLRYTPPATTGWRALLSPTDAGGSFSMWFLHAPDAGRHNGVLIGLVANTRRGILQCFASETVGADQLPGPHAVGELVSTQTDGGAVAVMLEAPFDFCRWRLQAVQAQHWENHPAHPLPEDYRLYQDHLWQFAAPAPDPALVAYFEEESDPPDTAGVDLDRLAADLLAQPAMAGWILQNRFMLQGVGPVAESLAHIPLDDLVHHMLRELEKRPEHVQLTAAVGDALRSQAAWLHLAGNTARAQDALLLARIQPHVRLSANPFVARLVEASLHAAGLPR
jgi:hypothetical protein